MNTAFRDLYRPGAKEGHFLVTYDIVPAAGLTLEEAAASIVLITTQRTLTRAGIEPSGAQLGSILNKPRFDRGRSWATVEIAFPAQLCQPQESLGQLLMVLTAAVEYGYAEKFWLRNVIFPDSFLAAYPGPRFGVEGIREVLGVERRPPLGLIVKPRWGGDITRTTDACRAALRGGVDFLVDDLLMGDPPGAMALRNRVGVFVDLCKEVTAETKTKKTYWPNITGRPIAAYEDAAYAIAHGAGGLVVDAYAMGFSFFEEFVDMLPTPVPILTTNMGSGIASRVPDRPMDDDKPRTSSESYFAAGVDEAVFALFSRVAGADGVHVGTTGSECFETHWDDPVEILYRELMASGRQFRRSFRVAEGDLDIGSIWINVDMLGKGHGGAEPVSRDVLIEATNAILGYQSGPGGPPDPRTGARLFRQVLDIVWEADSKDLADDALLSAAHKDRTLQSYLEQHRYFSLNA